MNKFLAVLAAVTLAVLARGAFPPPVEANASLWAQVCCGSACGGVDYCIGNGPYRCCKGVTDDE